jgi:hypothetical protein
MFGSQYFGGLILGVAVAFAPLAAPSSLTPGEDGGGFGTTYFGQYWPQISAEPVPGTAGGGFGTTYFGQYWPGTQFEAPPTPPTILAGQGSGRGAAHAVVRSSRQRQNTAAWVDYGVLTHSAVGQISAVVVASRVVEVVGVPSSASVGTVRPRAIRNPSEAHLLALVALLRES